MNVEDLAFEDDHFDAACCRIAAHHFPDVKRAVQEIGRVVRCRGTFVLEDSCVPAKTDLDAFINNLEKVRDPTHIRSYSEQEWVEILRSAGFYVDHTEIYRKQHMVEDWLNRSGADTAARAEVHRLLTTASDEAKDYFSITSSAAGVAEAFTDDKLILAAKKRAG
jgi:ubiquinone/menaquinone biosynthesis C-methylase UbiE